MTPTIVIRSILGSVLIVLAVAPLVVVKQAELQRWNDGTEEGM